MWPTGSLIAAACNRCSPSLYLDIDDCVCRLSNHLGYIHLPIVLQFRLRRIRSSTRDGSPNYDAVHRGLPREHG